MRVGVGPGRMGLGMLRLGSNPYFLVNQKVNFEKVLNDHDLTAALYRQTNWQRWRVGVDPGRITISSLREKKRQECSVNVNKGW